MQLEQSRPGETIFKGHHSYDLMLNLQLGIRWSVGKITQEPAKRTLEEAVFRDKVQRRLLFLPQVHRQGCVSLLQQHPTCKVHKGLTTSTAVTHVQASSPCSHGTLPRRYLL